MLLYQHMPLRLSFDICKEMFQELAKQIFKPTVKNVLLLNPPKAHTRAHPALNKAKKGDQWQLQW